MQPSRSLAWPAAILATALLGSAVPVAQAHSPAFAEPPPGALAAPRPPGPPHGADHPAPPGLDLSEAQQDQWFDVVHAQAPRARTLRRALRDARHALDDYARGPAFDEAGARQRAQAVGAREAELALHQAQVKARLNALLTPEQRERMATRAPRPGHPPLPGPADGR